MTQTPNPTPIDAQRALMLEIAASEKAAAVAYHSTPPMGGALGNKWDEQAAAFAKIVTAAELAAAKLAAIADGQASR